MANHSNGDTKLVVTRDGSHTVYSSRFDQHFHNPNGAVAESWHVFFEQPGLLEDLKTRDHLTILEVGFGTGLNLLLLMDYCLELEVSAHIDYYSVEGFPLSPDTAADFNYKEHLNHPEIVPEVTGIFGKLSNGMNHQVISENVTLHLFNGMFENFAPGETGANYIFHDAFSPDVNPELWTAEVFEKIKNHSSDDAILSTYCSASKVQGALASAGWKVAKTQGALGKREMILAALDADRLSDHKRINEEHYAQRYRVGDFD